MHRTILILVNGFKPNSKKNKMKSTAEILLKYMDKLHNLIDLLGAYLDTGMEFAHRIKVFIQRMLAYIEQGIEALVKTIGGRTSETNQMSEDYMFV